MTRPDLHELQGLDATSQAYDQLKEGTEYIAADRSEDVEDGAVALNVFVGNDAESDIDALVTVGFSTGGAATLDVTNNASVDTAGTPLPTQSKGVENGLRGTTLERGGTYTSTGEELRLKLPGTKKSTGPATTSGSDAVSGVRLLEPGKAVEYVVTNVSGGTADFGVTVSVIEISHEA